VAWSHLLETNGSIIVTSSRVSQQPAEYWTCYATTKSALNYFISCIALETAKIRCVALTPGAVDTDLMRNAMQGGKPGLANGRFYVLMFNFSRR